MWLICEWFILVNLYFLCCWAHNLFIMVLLYSRWLSRHGGFKLATQLTLAMLGLCCSWHQDVINRKLLKGRFLSGVWGCWWVLINGNHRSLYLSHSSWRLSLECISSTNTKGKVWILETASGFKWWWAVGCLSWVLTSFSCSLEICSFLLIICYSCRGWLFFSTRFSDFILAKMCLLLVIRISHGFILLFFG